MHDIGDVGVNLRREQSTQMVAGAVDSDIQTTKSSRAQPIQLLEVC